MKVKNMKSNSGNSVPNQFLNETKKETQAKIDSGEYKVTDLNRS